MTPQALERISHRRRRVAACLAAAVLCVCGGRAACLARRAPCLEAHGERTWFRWAHRHDDPQTFFAALAGRLQPGEPIVIAARQGGNETYWWRGMASYFLADHPVVAVVDLARRPGPSPGQALVVVRGDGVRVRRFTA